MTSFVINSEQPKLLHSFTPPASQPGTTSLHDKEAHSVPGKSKETAIHIPPDAEDEDDASHEFHGSQSNVTDTTVWDFLDLTVAEYGVTEPDVTIGANTASVVSPTQADAAPAWPIEPNEPHLDDARLSQQSCGVKRSLVANTPTECQDIHFKTPPTSPESQPYPVTVDGKQLRPEPTIQQEKMMANAVSAYDVFDSSHGHQDCPSTWAQSPQTASSVEVVQASLQEIERSTGKSCDDTIPEVRIPSPEMSSDELCPGQVLDSTDSASISVESEVTEAGSGSDAQVSSTSTSLRRFRHKYSQMHKTIQYKRGDAGSEVIRNEDRTYRLGSQHHKKNSSSLPDVENANSEDDDLDDVHLGRKRLKVSKPSSCAGTSSQSSDPRGPTAQAQPLQTRTQTSGYNIRSPTPSREPTPPVAEVFAQFEEWPLGGAILKRITEGSKTTFQLQFEWDPTSC
ncbi:hypothetical protein FOCG_17331 [Fusarium oxysporum f. sp. radicis-lycopersici 26381]|nr:hypothetical protein FOCG_17331 [Fusarium oxysporum f. sp. radicis-lycopersici 26381]